MKIGEENYIYFGRVSAKIIMNKDLEYFNDFLENPASYKFTDFTKMLIEFTAFLSTHLNEINFAKGEEWRETRERLEAAIQIKENMTIELKELTDQAEVFGELDNDEHKFVLYEKWRLFFKKHSADYYVPDHILTIVENRLETLSRSLLESDVDKESTTRKQKSLKEVEDAIFEHYERTGKRPVMTALKVKKNNKGN